MSIKISVIIPTYKRHQLLLKCLHSLGSQSFPAKYFEIIVVSDGPDELTLQQISSFKKEFFCDNIYFKNLPAKLGPAAARNLGASFAKASLLAFTDDDCLPGKNWLAALWWAWEKEGRAEIAFTGRTLVPINDPPTDYEKNIAHLQTAEFITANCACARDAFLKAGGFDESFPIAWREDSDFHFKLITNNIPVKKISEAIVVHPVRKARWGISLREQKKTFYDALLYKKHPLLFKQKIKAKPPLNYYAIIFFVTVAIVSMAKNQRLALSLSVLGATFFITRFALKRLKGTSRRTNHVAEMIVTSIAIPFLSAYWALRGSLHYKTLLL